MPSSGAAARSALRPFAGTALKRSRKSERASACFSNGEVLPPLGFTATLPVSSKRCIQITTTLGLPASLHFPKSDSPSA
jgi:hypothetical protein